MVKKRQRLHQDDDERDEEIEKDKGKKIKTSFWVLLGVVLLALIPRWYFLFFKADIQTFGSFWYGDVFHHWMIGYLTKEIGLAKGFLRLWDLKGLEYYWGLLHPMMLVGLFKVTGSADILIVRLLSLVCGVVSIALVWLIVQRYWNKAAAWGAAIIASLSPIGIFTDASGMTDPLSTVLVLGAIYLWPRKPFWAGTLLALSAMNRAEYWLFAVGLVLVSMVVYRNWDKRIAMFTGWLWLTALYMKYLTDKTGNAIYPVVTNFFATARGDWFEGKILKPDQLLYIGIAKGMFIATALVTVWFFKKKPRGKWLWVFGLMNMGFVTGILGFTAYKESWMDRIWVDRLWNWPQMFLGIFLAVVVLWWLPKRWKWWRKLKLGWLVIGGVVVGSQLLWQVFVKNDGFMPYKWGFYRPLAKIVADRYEGGAILLPERTDFLVYALVKYNGIEGKNFIGQMFGPFFYIEGDAFANWEEHRPTVEKFFKENDIRLMVLDIKYDEEPVYLKLIEQEPGWFTHMDTFGEAEVYRVNIE